MSDICKFAKNCGAYSVVDIAQSVGVVPIHIPDGAPDFVIGSSVKFICGGPGACFLYVAPHMVVQCAPVDVGWFSHENPFEMEIDNFRYADDAMRFFGGTPSPAPFACAASALKLWQDIGTPYARAQTMLSNLADIVADAYLVSPRNADKRGGTLVISPTDRAPLREALSAHKILHDERTEGFRFSVHGYTREQDVVELKRILAEVL